MQKLRKQATEQSGIPYSAVEEARSANLYEKLGWDKICALSNAFYTAVYNDEEWFRRLFANTTREAAMRNQREFLAQEFGGPPLYKERKGHTAILGRHGPYAVDGRAAERWLQHMSAAVHAVVEEEELQVIMMRYFGHMAWYIVFGKQLVNGMRTVGYYGKHTEGQV
ncbi:Globin/Protoglobin [Gracilaria domingensis]|nr:Globin/Protoglobin [Gracilaria domingensis]